VADKKLQLRQLIEWGHAVSTMPQRLQRRSVGTIWNDSRKVTKGDVFVAIRTESDDGHLYVRSALSTGAIAAIVAKKRMGDFTEREQLHLIGVNDPLKAVQQMAARYRKELGILFVGITGSSGKTTTRSFIASVLRRSVEVGETFSNWNNHIGVPLSILRFTGEEYAGIIEMGANHLREIHPLSMIVRPDIGVITNIGYAHVGLFGSLDNTTRAKFEIADGLNRNGFMLLNGDDRRCVKGAKERGLRSVFFGTGSACDLRAENISVDPRRGVRFTVDGQKFTLAMPGRHFIYCALPAIHIGRRCGIPDRVIAEMLAEQRPVSLRGTIEKKRGAGFIVDCYNANPSSMQSAIAYLSDLAKPARRVAVVGDMLELGSYAKRLHRELGVQLRSAGVTRIVAVGQFAADVARGYGKRAGASSFVTAETAENAIEAVRRIVRKGDTVLLKGSRGVRLETVFETF
jgi:UDP-N-acetylmuramoyl-tripeptide--D-alanyl-D-alanine ligase